MLWDLDPRFAQFATPATYARFNMFNRHFFAAEHESASLAYLDTCQAVVVDPPFGAPMGAFAAALNWLRLRNPRLKVFVYFPYFNKVGSGGL